MGPGVAYLRRRCQLSSGCIAGQCVWRRPAGVRSG
ncbi:hypothetical protein MMSP_0422 [Mycobacterium sp. 012931]|nr:hypothetical protein MMSP_0422 [Mycobacterium sp. 012931]